MKWDYFCNHYDEWAEPTLRAHISSLEDMGDGDSVAVLVSNLPSDNLKAQLIRKAMSLNVEFIYGTYFNLAGELPADVYQELAEYIGSDLDPCLDEDNLTWYDFEFDNYAWSEKNLLRRIRKLKDFGSPEDVCEAICSMPNAECEEALYQQAVDAGVKFTEDQLKTLGKNTESEEDWLYPTEPIEPERTGLGFWSTLFEIVDTLTDISENQKKDTGRCDGDCANCPPHYGYRYGRWYYGRGHRHGCQRGGNGGMTSSKKEFH